MAGASVELRVDIGGTDLIPHTFIIVTDPNGEQRGYGFAPKESHVLQGAGHIYNDLDHEWNKKGQATTGPIPLDANAHNKLNDYIQKSIENPPPYDLLFGSHCATWAFNGLHAADITEFSYPNMSPDNFIRDVSETLVWNPYTQWLAIKLNNFNWWTSLKDLFGTDWGALRDQFGKFVLRNILKLVEWGNGLWDSLREIGESITDLFHRARNWVAPRDPLALDLDGDGIETSGINAGVLFDHDADEIKTGTGWLKGDDAFLVLDRNGNGTIDSGRELFGVDTIKSNGQTATDGLDALADLDSNHDGVFDANDAAFADVRLWRDINQDGLSQANELSTLAQNEIVSINLNGNGTPTNLGNGNTLGSSATFTRADGSEGTAGNLNLADNPFYREFEDSIELSPEVASLPDMRGSGAVRDLREAAQLSPELSAQLSELVEAGHIDRAEYREQIVSLINYWADSADFHTSREVAESVPELNDTPMHLHYLPPGVTLEEANSIYDTRPPLLVAHVGGSGSGGGHGDVILSMTVRHDPTPEEIARREWIVCETARIEHIIDVLEIFNAARFVDFPHDGQPSVKTGAATTITAVVPNANSTHAGNNTPGGHWIIADAWDVPSEYWGSAYVQLSATQLALLEQSYEALINSVSDGLMLQTRLSCYFDAIQISVDETGWHINTNEINELLAARWAENPREAVEDYADLTGRGGALFSAVGWSGNPDLLLAWNEAAQNDEALIAYMLELKLIQSGKIVGTGEDDLLMGATGDDTLSGGDGNDTLVGGRGADLLNGGKGNDTLDGGAGSDTLDGGFGSDTYLIHRDDQDTVADYEYNSDNVDTVRFIDIAASEVLELRKNGNDLVIYYGESGTLTLKNHFYGTAYQIERFEFADEVLNMTELFARHPVHLSEVADNVTLTSADDVVYGYGGNDTIRTGDGNDTVYGGEGNDTVYGGKGNDVLHGDAGNDVLNGEDGDDDLNGGEGDDTLNGGNGNDILTGGVGNDRLDGGAGDDVYRFARGDGQDIIVDSAGNDLVQFGEGIDFDQLWFSKSGNDLMVSLIGTGDRVTVNNWYASTSYRVEQFESGGQILNATEVQALVDAMASHTPPPVGTPALGSDYAELLEVIGSQWEMVA